MAERTGFEPATPATNRDNFLRPLSVWGIGKHVNIAVVGVLIYRKVGMVFTREET